MGAETATDTESSALSQAMEAKETHCLRLHSTGIREQMFPYTEETLAAVASPTGYSSGHFSTTVPPGIARV